MPSLLPQLDNDSILLMYHAGELSAEDAETVERMLANDAGLRAKLDELRSAYDAAGAALDEADARERLVLPAASAARRVGLAARAWNARRQGEPDARRREPDTAARRLRFPWWAYPLASAAAMVIAAVAWWGFQPDNGLGKRFEPIDSLAIGGDEDLAGNERRPDAFAGDLSPDDAIVRTWENYVVVSGADEPAEVNLDEAEDELFALADPSRDEATADFYESDIDEQ